MDKVRVGIIGVGGIAYGHIRNFLASPDAEIVGLVDIDPARLEKAVEKVPELQGVPTYSDYRDMISRDDIDAVQINTPHTLHYQQIMDSLDAGLHVLTEKPMVCTTQHARDIIKKRDETGKVVMISYQRHFQPQYRYMKRAIENGEIGEVTYLSALQCQGWKKGTAGTWRQIPELSGGGQLNDSGSHLLDMVLWLTGLTAESVFAYIDNCGTPVDINSALSLKFTNGAEGTVSVVGDSACRWYEDFTIWGTKGVLFYRNGKLIHCNEAGEMIEPTDLPPGGNHDQGFCDVILGRDKNWVPAECGLRVIELTEAAWRSAQMGKPCEVASL
ncbi:MAG: Gfo/Idh/MocA family oxidoreductase [Armatimonadota bacterium]|nr:Gfo/Idh/MocA family oxidoreductase [Armatimonadota bacterium]